MALCMPDINTQVRTMKGLLRGAGALNLTVYSGLYGGKWCFSIYDPPPPPGESPESLPQPSQGSQSPCLAALRHTAC